MFKKILQESIAELLHNNKLIRLAFIVTFCHSLSTFFLLAWNANNMLNYKFNTGVGTFTIIGDVFQAAVQNNLITWLIVAIIIVIIGYGIFYPIGQAAIVHFLHNKDNSIGTAIGKGTGDFFTMFEYNALNLSFGMFTFVITVARLFMLDIVDNIFFIILIIIWLIAVLLATFLWPYIRYAIVLEDKPLYAAMKRSINLSFMNLATTIRFAILELVLLARFIINIIIVIGVPVLLIYIATLFNIENHTWFYTMIYIIGAILIILAAYINAIIEALFITYWYKLYTHITGEKVEK